jgi:hypothetical protein
MSPASTPVKATNYSGIYWQKGKHAWRVLIRCRAAMKGIHFGYYDDPADAAWVADFARYMIFGVDVRNWHFTAGRPNFPPRGNNNVARAAIVHKLLSRNVLRADKLHRNLLQYDASCH